MKLRADIVQGTFKVGARGSRLSRAQTYGAMAFLSSTFPGTHYEFIAVSTPGDRDLTTPIEKSAPDFFTRDLDDAVRSGRIDFAVHSAKDLPPPDQMPSDLDWFWLPCREDRRDALVVRRGTTRPKSVGVSSARREEWVHKYLPKARCLPIRGSVDSRLAQLNEGKYDAVLMAGAALARLGMDLSAFVIKPLPLAELTPPEAQGVLAIVYLRGNKKLDRMRARFVKAVRFVSAGVGSAGLLTLRGAKDVAEADVVLCDDLLGAVPTAKTIHVGKRCGAHSMPQVAITQLICNEARKGKRVVRLKGGDAGLFGRLAEETDALTALNIPFVVRPGVSALTAATTGTGMLLTRRGVARGFTVYTPRSQGTHIPLVMFMAAKMLAEECANLRRQGYDPTTPCALVLEAAGANEEVRQGTLALPPKFAARDTRPGLFIVGEAVCTQWPRLGYLAGQRVLLTCSAGKVMDDAVRTVEDGGGRPVEFPLINLVPRKLDLQLRNYDWVVLTSPSSVRLFLDQVEDLRQVPHLATCGALTDEALRERGLRSDLMPAEDFSAAGLIKSLGAVPWQGKKVLRLRSAKAGAVVAKALTKLGAVVTDQVLYDNQRVEHTEALPKFDAVFFASASAVEAFLAKYGERKLRTKGIYVMGGPTRAALPVTLQAKAQIFNLSIKE